MSVCQIGATIGRMWRELSEADKQHHLEDFNQDKVCKWFKCHNCSGEE